MKEKNKSYIKNFRDEFIKFIEKYSKIILFIVFIVFIAIVVNVVAFLYFPNQSSFIMEHISFGNMIPKESEDKNENQKNHKEEIRQQYQSNFIDNKWTEDERWLRNEQVFTFTPDKTGKGGPKIDFKNLVSESFHLTLDFEPVENENNKNNEINLVIYVGDLYEVVLGDGNRENFYLKAGGKYIPDIKNNLNKNALEHPIMFDEWMKVSINQSVLKNSKKRLINVSFFYCPYIFGFNECEQNEPEIFYFEIDDSSDPEKVSRLISIGLRNSSNVIKTKFHYFELENR